MSVLMQDSDFGTTLVATNLEDCPAAPDGFERIARAADEAMLETLKEDWLLHTFERAA